MSQSGDWSGLQILGGWKPQAFDSPSGAVFIIFFPENSFNENINFEKVYDKIKTFKIKELKGFNYNDIIIWAFF